MKRYGFLMLFILPLSFLFGQDEFLTNKIKNIKLQQIVNDGLTDYDMLKQTKGKITIVNFWETWSSDCVLAMQHLKDLKKEFSSDLQVVCVSSDDLDRTINFIGKGSFPFDFVYDSEKLLSDVFPHLGIPHSILVDKYGKILAWMHPGYVTEEVINNMIKNKAVELPDRKFFDSNTNAGKHLDNSLEFFDLKPCNPGGKSYVKRERKEQVRKKKKENEEGYIDRPELISKTEAAGLNILELYQYAYHNMPTTRFIYDKELKYINSNLDKNRYDMIFTSSDWLGDHNLLLINKLNNKLGLQSTIVEKRTEVLVLDSLGFERSQDKFNSGISTNQSELRYKIDATYVNSEVIVETLESFLETPIETNIPATNFYDIKIDIRKGSVNMKKTQDIDSWIEAFNQNGIYLRKDTKTMKFVKIEKVEK